MQQASVKADAAAGPRPDKPRTLAPAFSRSSNLQACLTARRPLVGGPVAAPDNSPEREWPFLCTQSARSFHKSSTLFQQQCAHRHERSQFCKPLEPWESQQ